jgi:hypothetical protein
MTQNQTWRRYVNTMKTIKLITLFLGIALTSFTQNPGEIAFRNESRNAMRDTNDEAAIRAVCEKETQSWNNRDAEGMISCHANTSYSLLLVVENGNVHYITAKSDVDSEKSIRDLVKIMGEPSGDTFLNYGYVIHINGSSAFAYYDEKVKAEDGKETNFHEVRNLEKMDGKWKIIYVGAVEFKQEGR